MYLQTERLTLRPLSEKDDLALYRILSDERVAMTYMVPSFATEEEGLKLARRLRALSSGERILVVGIYHNDTLVGLLNETERTAETVELGYVVDPAHQNHGYASEALTAVIEALFAEEFFEITAGAFEFNLPSIRVMQKCGMTKTKKKAVVEYRGKLQPCVYYSVFRSDRLDKTAESALDV